MLCKPQHNLVDNNCFLTKTIETLRRGLACFPEKNVLVFHFVIMSSVCSVFLMKCSFWNITHEVSGLLADTVWTSTALISVALPPRFKASALIRLDGQWASLLSGSQSFVMYRISCYQKISLVVAKAKSFVYVVELYTGFNRQK